MKERRQYERFLLSLPAMVETIDQGENQIFEFQTRDISAGGAFLDTTEPFSIGTRFRLKLNVPSERIEELTGAQTCIKTEGTVVRSTPTVMALCFDGKSQILSLRRS